MQRERKTSKCELKDHVPVGVEDVTVELRDKEGNLVRRVKHLGTPIQSETTFKAQISRKLGS